MKRLLSLVLMPPLLVGVVLMSPLLRRVRPYQVSSTQTTNSLGNMDEQTSEQLQALLDQEVNRLNVSGLQLSVHTRAGRTWSGTSSTVDLTRKIPLGRDHMLRGGSVTKMFTAVTIFKLTKASDESRDGLCNDLR